jgi:FKBP-type peptidyl-prolyl cis-trans isomerase (trigger factor)
MRPDMSNHVQVRVQVPGKATQKVFDEALVILARDAPPVPGFRKSKGGTDDTFLL